MRIRSARIKNYRTVKDEISFDLRSGITLVGPNNAGKTNVLKAIRVFFTGYENQYRYDRAVDLSHNQGSTQSSVAITFFGDRSAGDKDIYEQFHSIRDALGLPPDENEDITVYLTFSATSKPVYRVFPNTKRPTTGTANAQYSRIEKRFVETILANFSIHYIPSDKSTSQLYGGLVLPFLFKKAHGAILSALPAVKTAMAEAAQALTSALHESGLKEMSCSFSFPDSPERIFKEAYFNILDPNETNISEKGMGIQSAALLAAFIWITKEESRTGKSVVWLLEEPESYLHPELAHQCRNLISLLRDVSQVVTTTHSLGFVPQEPTKILGVERLDGWTKTSTFKTYTDATSRIRRSLGVRFSDFYNLNIYNIIVEGETDGEFITHLIGKIANNSAYKKKFPILVSGKISLLDFGGVKGIEGFVKATYEFIYQERPCVIMLDGDKAGDDCRKAIQGFLGKKRNTPDSKQTLCVCKRPVFYGRPLS